MPQPIGPQDGAERPPPKDSPPPPPPTEAGRDIWRATSWPPQVGQRTSASSLFLITSSSKDLAQGVQAYS